MARRVLYGAVLAGGLLVAAIQLGVFASADREADGGADLRRQRAAVAHMQEMREHAIHGGRVASVFDFGGDHTIAVRDLDTGAVRHLRTPEERPALPVLSRDGRWLAYLGAGELIVRRLDDDTPVRRLAERGRLREARLSDDGALLAFVQRPEDAPHELHLLRLGPVLDDEQVQSEIVHRGDVRSVIGFSTEGHLAFVAGGKLLVRDPGGEAGGRVREFATRLARRSVPAWSAQAPRLVYSVGSARRAPGPCRLEVVDMTGGGIERIGTGPCSQRLAFLSGDDAIAHLDDDSALRVTSLGDRRTSVVATGLTRVHAFGAGPRGAVLWTNFATDHPMTLWRHHDGVTRAIEQPLPPSLVTRAAARAVAERSTLTTDDGEVALYRVPRTCGDPEAPGPAVLWVHCGGGRFWPRWTQERQFLSMLGATVFAIDYRETDTRPPGLPDVEAALAHVRARPDVDPAAVSLFFCCNSSELGYGLLRRHPGQLARAIDLIGDPGPWIAKTAEGVDKPPIFYASFTRDPSYAGRELIADRIGDGLDLDRHRYETNHAYQGADVRPRLLNDMAAFLAPTLSPSCRP